MSNLGLCFWGSLLEHKVKAFDPENQTTGVNRKGNSSCATLNNWETLSIWPLVLFLQSTMRVACFVYCWHHWTLKCIVQNSCLNLSNVCKSLPTLHIFLLEKCKEIWHDWNQLGIIEKIIVFGTFSCFGQNPSVCCAMWRCVNFLSFWDQFPNLISMFLLWTLELPVGLKLPP